MMHEDYDMREQMDEGDAPFPGGSTEAKDAFLAERGHVRNTPAQSADFRAALREAQAKLDAPDADLMAWAGPLTEGRTWSHRDAYIGYLQRERRVLVGRALRTSEYRAVVRVGEALWRDLRAVA